MYQKGQNVRGGNQARWVYAETAVDVWSINIAVYKKKAYVHEDFIRLGNMVNPKLFHKRFQFLLF